MNIFADGGGDGIICVIFVGRAPMVSKIDVRTHNEAEYGSLLWSLEQIDSYEHYDIYMDSQLVIYQMTGEYRVKHPVMKTLYHLANEYIDKRGLDVSFHWLPREENLAGLHLEQWKKNAD